MNIFSNNCACGHIYRIIGEKKFSHPLYWTLMTEEDFVLFCQEYDNIDLNDYEIVDYYTSNLCRKYSDKDFYKTNGVHIQNLPIIRYSNGVEVGFPNHRCNYIDMYQKRIDRYLKEEDTVFILSTWIYNTDNKIVNDFINLDIPYKKILITPNEKYKYFENDKTLVIVDGRYPGELAHDVSIKIKDFINEYNSNNTSKEGL